jgi:alkylation response protein AidB-like acyl-CoA dehydrogenase
MDFGLNEQEKMLQSGARDFAAKSIRPHAGEIDKGNRFPAEIVREMAALGYKGLPFPAAYGGGGTGYISAALALEQVSQASATVGSIMAVNTTPQEAIFLYGTEAQKQRFLPPLAQGEGLGCIMFTEAETGSDPRLITTLAKPQGDDYIVNGHKQFVANAPGASHALLFANNEAGKLNAFILEMNTPGIDIRAPFEMMGLRGAGVCEVFLDDVKLPAANRLRGDGEGFDVLLDAISLERIGVSLQAVGLCQETLDMALEYAKNRVAVGKPIAKLPTIQWLIAEMQVNLEAARWMAYHAAYIRDRGESIRVESAKAKLFATQAAVAVTGMGMQVHGAYGTIQDVNLERLYRDARMTQIYVGNAEIMRVIVASSLL